MRTPPLSFYEIKTYVVVRVCMTEEERDGRAPIDSRSTFSPSIGAILLDY